MATLNLPPIYAIHFPAHQKRALWIPGKPMTLFDANTIDDEGINELVMPLKQELGVSVTPVELNLASDIELSELEQRVLYVLCVAASTPPQGERIQ